MGCVSSRPHEKDLSENKKSLSVGGGDAPKNNGLPEPAPVPYEEALSEAARPVVEALVEQLEQCGPLSKPELRARVITSGGVQEAAVPAMGLKLRYAYVSQRGFYPDSLDKANQDKFCVHINYGDDPNTHFFGVFDGHGESGTACAEGARDWVPANVLASVHWPNDVPRAYQEAFLKANQQMHVSTTIDDTMSGTTGITILVKGDTLYIGNVGDSRAVLAEAAEEGMVAWDLSHDQTPFRADECARVKRAGARVLTMDQLEGLKDPRIQTWGGEDDDDGDPPRLWSQFGMYPGTAFTRSIGDQAAERIGVIADPEITIKELGPSYPFFVLASDGVFEFLTSQLVVEMVARFSDPFSACAHLVAESYRQWLQYETRTDDITVIVCFVDYPEEGMANASDGMSPSPSMMRSGSSRLERSLSVADVVTPKDPKDMSSKVSNVIRRPIEPWEGEPEEARFPVHKPKPEEKYAQVVAAMEKHFLFAALDARQRELVFNGMERIYVEPGEVVVREGEDASHMYIIEEGSFDMYTKQGGDDQGHGKWIGKLPKEGRLPCFGELSLLYLCQRECTVRAKGEGILWAMDRASFKGGLSPLGDGAATARYGKLCAALRAVEPLQALTVHQLNTLVGLLQEATYARDQVLSSSAADSLFIVVLQGAVACVHKGSSSDDNPKVPFTSVLGSWECYGERGLLGVQEDVEMRVDGKEAAVVLQTTRTAFEGALGPLSDILANHPRYKEGRRIPTTKAALQAYPTDLTYKATVYSSSICSISHVTGRVPGEGVKSFAEKVYRKADIARSGTVWRVMESLAVEQRIRAETPPSVFLPPLVAKKQEDASLSLLLATPVPFVGSMTDVLAVGTRPMGEDCARFYAASLVLVLETLHDAHIVFRGMSPCSLMIDNEGWLQVGACCVNEQMDEWWCLQV
eukprot:jgi/Mesvir1/7329/Mv19140-RA.2